jgi:hypothetical protein
MKLKLIVTSSIDGKTRELTLNDLPGEAKDYFPLLNNDWVRTRLDLKDGEKVDLAENGLVLDSENILYESDDAKVQIGTIKSAPAEKQHCWRDGNDPSFFSYSDGCGMKKMCLINVKCKLPGEDYTVSARAFCKANINNTCPSPDECAADTDTDVQLVD